MSPTLQAISFFVDQFYRYPFSQDMAFKTIRDSLSTGQMKSKMAIVDFFKKSNMTSDKAIFVGHWHSLLPLILNKEGIVKTATGVEKSDLWSDFSNYLNRDWQWTGLCQSIENYSIDPTVDLVINTSCEHMADSWISKVPTGSRVFLQSTNYEHLEHVNRKMSLNDFTQSLNEIDILNAFETDCDVYSRYNVFGIKK